MFPSSPVSVGMFPSNRTLEAGAVHVLTFNPRINSVLKVALEQCPVGDDPFADGTP